MSAPVYSVPPVERACRVLRHIARGESVANISATARVLKISRTTLIRLLATLENEEMIERRGDDYVLGLGLAGLAGRALVTNDVVLAGEARIGRLAEDLALSAHLGVLRGRDVLYLARRTPNAHLVSNVSVGSRLPAHATTMGRIILAHLAPSEVAALYDNVEMPASTQKTPTSVPALLAALKVDRDRRIAWSDGNFERGIASAAVAIFDRTGAVAGAINVTGPSAAFQSDARRSEIENALRLAANQISQRLGYEPERDAGGSPEPRPLKHARLK